MNFYNMGAYYEIKRFKFYYKNSELQISIKRGIYMYIKDIL